VTDVFRRFHRLRVSQKLMLVSCVFMIPDSVLLMLFLFSINGYIHFAQWERYGSEYQRPLERLLDYLPAHRLLARGVGASLDAGDAALQRVEHRVDNAFVELEATNARIGEHLQFTDEGLGKRHREHFRVDTVKSEWLDLKAHVATLSVAERDARHLHLLADIRTMIAHAGDTSNLILDPDLDSYYLMDATLLALPQAQVRLAAVMAYDVFAPGHVITREEQSRLAAYAALMKDADLDRVVASTRTALNEDVNFYGQSESLQRKIPPLLDDFVAATEEFIRMTSALSHSDRAPEVSDAFHAAGERARGASFRLWSAMDQELDGLLVRRIDHFKTRRAASLGLTALAALAAIGLVTFITRSISVPLKRQAAELRESNQTLQASMERYRLLVESTHAVPWEVDGVTKVFSYISPQATRLLGYDVTALIECMSLVDLVHDDDRSRVCEQMEALSNARVGDLDIEHRVLTAQGRVIDVRSVVTAHAGESAVVLRGITVDVTKQKKLERELHQAQKLESVGRLAAGVAHEINTPVQFVSDSVHFVRDAVNELVMLIGAYQQFHREVAQGTAGAEAVQAVERAAVDADLEYFMENVPKALDRSLEGLGRVTTIVRSMKEFAHPDRKEMSSIDVNQAIQSTLIIARSEYKYVADVETDFGELPRVMAYGGDVNQVLLNVIVNAAHAIGSVVEGTDRRGRITVRTRHEGDYVSIRISDTGGGIPEAIRNRVFDPFFTTKGVGRGTGQGLAIARALVVDKHGGEFIFETEPGQGTTFIIRIPVEDGRTSSGEAAA
jgi:PAS domain S-box-containing protein